MSVIVDTSVWSLAFRRHQPSTLSPSIESLQRLIEADQVRILGAIRQELLSGIRNAEQFERLRKYLTAFSDLEVKTQDYELAAEFLTPAGVEESKVLILTFWFVQLPIGITTVL